jgi:transcriptional regulator GlxA family with amidase domain
MKILENETLSLEAVTGFKVDTFISNLRQVQPHDEKVKLADELFLAHFPQIRSTPIDRIIERIQQTGGQLSISTLCDEEKMSMRKLERSFNEVVGIPAKTYMRLIRFNCVFKLIQQKELTKAEATYLCGYFDQAHFNKDFRTFSGEDPGTYFKKNHAFSNFFMNR